MHSEFVNGGTDMTLTIALLEAGRRLLRQPAVWRQRSQTRAQLAALPERQLRDIGLSPEVVAREAQKRFWQPLGMLGDWGDTVGLDVAARSAPALRQVPRALRPAATFPPVLLPWRS
jgi:uncharacterized protein YjiS (DUF1127 family)